MPHTFISRATACRCTSCPLIGWYTLVRECLRPKEKTSFSNLHKSTLYLPKEAFKRGCTCPAGATFLNSIPKEECLFLFHTQVLHMLTGTCRYVCMCVCMCSIYFLKFAIYCFQHEKKILMHISW